MPKPMRRRRPGEAKSEPSTAPPADSELEGLYGLTDELVRSVSAAIEAGTQTLIVAVRALATNELTASNALRIVGKEALVGCVNGILFSFTMGAVACLWLGDPKPAT